MTDPVPFRHLTRVELDHQLSPSRSARDARGVLARHLRDTACLASAPALRLRRDLPYGPGARQKIDIYAPASGRNLPCVVFLHGGFWQEGDKAGAGFAAPALAAAGWALAVPGYTLAPEARLGDILAEVGAALTLLHRDAAHLGLDPARIVLSGHSAGGHLAAAVLAGLAGPAACAAVAGAMAVSGVYDLAPVAASYVNDALRLDPAEAPSLSPLFTRPCRDIPLHLLVGADEPAAFRDQTLALHRAWTPHLSCLTLDIVPGQDHFDILDHLANPQSPAFQRLVSLA